MPTAIHPSRSDSLRRTLVIGVLGVVYGDIGISPIYPLGECLKAAGADNSPEVVLGLLLLGRETPVPTTRPELTVWREKLYAFMTRNAVSASDHFQIPSTRVVELGTPVEI
jgi:K+ transporter